MCRHVRQDTPLNKALHAGMLTSGYINAALGFYEPAAARRLGVPTNRVKHSSLLNAVLHLCQPVYQPPSLPSENPPLCSRSPIRQPGASPPLQQGKSGAVRGAAQPAVRLVPQYGSTTVPLICNSCFPEAAGKVAGRGPHVVPRGLNTAAVGTDMRTSVGASLYDSASRVMGQSATRTTAWGSDEKLVDSAAVAAGGKLACWTVPSTGMTRLRCGSGHA
jgi:hypothetical protein